MICRKPRSLARLVGLLLFASSAAAELHTPHCIQACPEGAPNTNDVIVRSIYTLSSNDTTRFADWVAYHVTTDTIGSGRTRKWMADPALEDDETLEPDDYQDAHRVLGTDRGHLAPLASFSGTAQWFQTNYLSNITPQASGLNQGPWSRLESAIRTTARGRGQQGVFVLTGTLYERPMSPLPGADEPHLVPSGYWKTVAIVNDDQIHVAGFIFDQDTPRRMNFCRAIAPLDTIRRRSHLILFPELPQEAVIDQSDNLLRTLGCSPTTP